MILFSETIETLLKPYQSCLGDDYTGYKNHLYRVVNFCHLQAQLSSEQASLIEIAAVFHDLALWTSHTADYVQPSEALARRYLQMIDCPEWIDDVCRIISEHHKITAVDPGDSLPEIFRRADWIDLTYGWRHFGTSKQAIQDTYRVFPDMGFHPLLARIIRSQLFRHPLNPLPMLKW
jgi:predicted metal-dependent HD superfamily phosphohydrolase